MTSTVAVPAAVAPSRGPFRLAVAMLVVTTVTILKGAMTTSTGSGMAYPDWPLSDGQLMPVSSYTTVPGFLEHFHRLFAAGAGLIAAVLAVWLTAHRIGDRLVRRCAWFGGCLILVQGIVGGTGVLKNLPAVTSVTHGTLAQLTLAMFAWIAYQLSDRYRATQPLPGVAPGSGRLLLSFALVVLVAQTVVGALARHTNSAHALWTHVGNSFVVFVVGAIATAFAVGRLGAVPGVRGIARAIVTLLVVQIALGFVVLAIRNPEGKRPENVADLGTALVISVHVLLGALLTVLVATLTAHVFRATRVSRPGAARESE
jgi:heme A synthase